MDNTDKDNLDKRMPLSKKEIIEFLDIGVKSLPIIIIILLLGSVCFNFFYFLNIDMHFMSLLSIQDYYEGSAIYFFIILSTNFIIIYNFFISKQKLNLELLFKSIRVYCEILNLILKILTTFKKIIRTKLRLRLTQLKYNNLPKNKNIEVELKEINSDIKKSEELNYSNFKELLSMVFKIIFVIICCIIMLIISFIPLFFLLSYNSNNYIFLEIVIFYLLLYSIAKINKVFNIFLILLFLYFGWMGYSGYAISNYIKNNTTTVVSTKTKDTYKLIRIVSKGAIVFKDGNYIFIKWEDIETVNKSKC